MDPALNIAIAQNIATNGRLIVAMLFVLNLMRGSPTLALLCTIPLACSYVADILTLTRRALYLVFSAGIVLSTVILAVLTYAAI